LTLANSNPAEFHPNINVYRNAIKWKKYAHSLKLVSSLNRLVKGAHGQKQMQSMHVQTLAM